MSRLYVLLYLGEAAAVVRLAAKYCNSRASAQLAESRGRDFLAPEEVHTSLGTVVR